MPYEMKMFTGIVVFWLAAYTIPELVSAEVVKNCTENSQCGPGQCCQKLRKFMMMSKREAVDHDTLPGTCESYRAKGDLCTAFEKANGYCSCEPGTKCAVTEKSKRSRRMIMGNAVYKCLKIK